MMACINASMTPSATYPAASRRSGLALLAAAAGLCVCGTAMAQIPWAPYPGPGVDFTHSGGVSDNGAAGFGSPTVAGNAFIFEPTSFIATSNAGVTDSAADRMQVDLLPSGIPAIEEIVIIEEGMITGDLSALGSDVIIDGDVTIVTNTSVFPGVVLGSLDVTITPIDANTATWTAFAQIDLSPQIGTGFLPVTEARLILENVITAESGAGASLSVSKDRVRVFVPTPASVALLAGAGVFAARRRRG